MAQYTFLTCSVPSADFLSCDSGLAYQTIEVYDQSALELALITLDLDIVGAIFGGGLTLFVTGIAAGMLVNIIKQAR